MCKQYRRTCTYVKLIKIDTEPDSQHTNTNIYTCIRIHTDKKLGADRHTETLPDCQIARQLASQADRHTDDGRQTDIRTYTDRQTHRQHLCAHTIRQTDRQADIVICR